MYFIIGLLKKISSKIDNLNNNIQYFINFYSYFQQNIVKNIKKISPIKKFISIYQKRFLNTSKKNYLPIKK